MLEYTTLESLRGTKGRNAEVQNAKRAIAKYSKIEA